MNRLLNDCSQVLKCLYTINLEHSLQLQSTLNQSSFKNCFNYLIANVTFKELLDFLSPLKMPQN